MLTPYDFANVGEFVDRRAELAAMEDWWASGDRDALLLTGRRRVGKSWLFRRFAHGRPAVVLVGERLPVRAQLDRFQMALGDAFGIAPHIDDVPDLFRVLLALGRRERYLAVVDEFPYLLPATARARDAVVTGIQAALEERDRSRVGIILCGSQVAVMSELLGARSGLHGRLRPLRVEPMSIVGAGELLAPTDPLGRIERYAVCGGMARHLALLGREGGLRDAVCRHVLSPNAALFDDPRDVLEQELRQTDNYFGVIEALARRRALGNNALANAIGRPETALPQLLGTMREMGLIERVVPFGAPARAHGQSRLRDPFLRFWFRFVFPFQESLAAGLPPEELWDRHIAPALPEHVSWVFEDICRMWVLRMRGGVAPQVRSWWGPAGAGRRLADRRSEEIDLVGGVRRSVRLVGECKWTAAPMGIEVLDALERDKLPALRHGGLSIARDAEIILFSRAGFGGRLVDVAGERGGVTLVDGTRLLADLGARGLSDASG